MANQTQTIGIHDPTLRIPRSIRPFRHVTARELAFSSLGSSNDTYLLPNSPTKTRNMAAEKGGLSAATVLKTNGQRPACLVNASVTYCGNNQIYAFGGFDQYTDEGMRPVIGWAFLFLALVTSMECD